MASSTNSKRQNTLTSLSPYPKPTISVEEWEAKAPLSDPEARSVNLVKKASERSSLPSKSSVDESASSSRPSTPTVRNKLAFGSRPSTPNPLTASRSQPSHLHALHPKQPIQTPQQYYDWFALIDRSVTHSQEAHFRAHLAGVAEHLDTCDGLVQRIDEVDQALETMLQEWRSVEDGGKSLKDACEQLLEERDRLISMMEAIGERLDYFQELEHATRMLNSPGDSLVLQTDFLYMVERVDICIDYLKTHRHFREAEIYLLRFQQCMTRAMTLIKMYFVGSLRALTQDVSRRMSEKAWQKQHDVSATAQMHLLYTRFNSVSSQLAPLLAELERRAQVHPEELSALLSECHTAYFAARKSLLVGRLVEEIRGLDPTRTELVELTRAGCSYLKQLCTDEFNLFRSFFNSGEEQLYQYLENLCDYLYDDLRPRILHEPRLTALCEVCTVLQALMVLDVPLPEGDSDEETDELLLDLEHRPRRKKLGLRMLHISHLLEMVLQDAQTRLFFKAQAVIQSDVRYYVSKPEDLAYPDKLVAARKPVSNMEGGTVEKESVSELFKLKSMDKQDTWYPTLRTTVWVLSQLHEFVKPAIFDDIAQEAVTLCRQSLVSASETLRSKHVPPSSTQSTLSPSAVTLDSHLFLVRHLLILKEIVQSLDLEQRSPDKLLDFSAVTDTLASMLERTSALLPTALFASLGMPRDENMSDIQQGIDQELKRACEDVITAGADSIVGPVRAFYDRVGTIVRLNSANPSSELQQLTTKLWAMPGTAQSLLDSFRAACVNEPPKILARLRLYLEDERTVLVLAGHICDKVCADYRRWAEMAKMMFGGVVVPPPVEEIRQLLLSAGRWDQPSTPPHGREASPAGQGEAASPPSGGSRASG
ncbi:Sec34-like family-domain-containing protein [Sparassis latifolia]